MFAYVVRRLWQIVPTLLGVVLLVFFLFTWFGGDPAYLLAGKISNPEQIESIRRQLGVDRPYYVQLWIFIQQIATGDFGESWSTNEKVSAIFATRLVPGPGLGQRLCRKFIEVQLVADHRWGDRVAGARYAALPQLFSRRDQPGLCPHRAGEGHERDARDVGARAAQCFDPDHHQRDDPAAGAARGREALR